MKAYRLLTGDDSSAFCHKVTEALSRGWSLYGDPAIAHDPASGTMRCAQAVVKEVGERYAPDLTLGAL